MLETSERLKRTRRPASWALPQSSPVPAVEQFARERDELFKPERLIAKLGTKLTDFVRLGIVEVVIARYDSNGSVRQTGNGSDGAEELKSARQRHAEIQNDRVRPMSLCQIQSLVGRQRGPDLVALQTKHSRKCVGYANVIVNDEHPGRGLWLGRRRRHRRHYAIFSPFGRRI